MMKRSLLLSAVLVMTGSAAVTAQTYSIQQYLNIKSASAPSFSPDGRAVAYLTNTTGTNQIWALGLPAGKPRQLTSYDDNVAFVRWLDGGDILFGKAKGGDENTQLLLIRPDGSGVRELTNDSTVQYNFGVSTEDGKTIAYAANKRNRQFFDIYTMDVASGKETLAYQNDGNNDVVAINDAASKIVVSRDGLDYSLDNNLYLVDLRTGKDTLLTPHSGASEFGNVHFTADGLVYTHNDRSEYIGLAQMRKQNASVDDWSDKNRISVLVDSPRWDIGDVEMRGLGGALVYTVNRDGYDELYLRSYETDGKPLITVIDKKAEQVKLPARGIVGGMQLTKDESKLAFTFASSTHNSNVWIYDLKAKRLDQITHSDVAGIDARTFVEPQLIRYKTFDAREIPAWFYVSPIAGGANANGRIASAKRLPVIVSVHGGPEGQERPGFSGLYQYYLSRGYSILATNVRGSTGYGKSFTHLDDVRKREDSVRDLSYAVNWLKENGGADPKRIAVMGGSYGGYMTLAAITLYPDLWAAAVDTVGIGNWETFLKNTSSYRRRQREVEYGSLEKDGDFLRSISPISKIDRIKTPLFVIAGRNDPRVPYTEGEQMVSALRKRGATVEWKLYDDEGHGIAKLKNRLELYPLVADFLDRFMK